MIGFSEIQDYSFYFQYTLLCIYLIWEFKNKKLTIRKENLILFLMLFYTSVIPILTGYVRGYDLNVKPIILSIILMVAVSSRLVLPTKKLFQFLIIFILLEYLLSFTILPEFHRQRSIGFVTLIRPIGPVVDMHLTSLLLAFLGFNYFKNRYYSTVITAMTMNIQGLIVSLLLSLSGINYKRVGLSAIFIIIFIVSLFYFTIDAVGYLDADSPYALSGILYDLIGTDWLTIIDPFCLFFGCSFNVNDNFSITQAVISNANIMTDVGYLRILYQFGLPWLIVVFIILWRLSRLGALAIFLSAFHYPVAFGLLGLPIFVHILKSWKLAPEYKKI
jgi:hypothetical protein